MRNVIFTLFSAFLLLNGASASAQFITSNSNKDTAVGYYDGNPTLNVHNDVKSSTTAPVYLKWHVVNSSFGPGWDIVGSGFCDNVLCYSAFAPTGNLFTDHTVQKSDAYTNSNFGDFKMVFASSNPPNGSFAWVQIEARDTVSPLSATNPRTLNYFAYKNAAGITTTITSSDDVMLFPNPAREFVNVIFDGKAGVKTIAIYNLIGKLIGPVYRPSDNNSAKIELNDMPNGVYFLRLMNGQGQVVATRRFIRQ
jgi:hypothetical protein